MLPKSLTSSLLRSLMFLSNNLVMARPSLTAPGLGSDADLRIGLANLTDVPLTILGAGGAE